VVGFVFPDLRPSAQSAAKPGLDFQQQFFKEPLFSPPERPFVPESVSICGQIWLNPRSSAVAFDFS
jgi:hypothetical protein